MMCGWVSSRSNVPCHRPAVLVFFRKCRVCGSHRTLESCDYCHAMFVVARPELAVCRDCKATGSLIVSEAVPLAKAGAA